MDNMNQCASGTCGTCHSGRHCGCFHHKIAPAAVLLIALSFLLKTMGVVSVNFVDVAWPILIGIAALVKLTAGSCKCYSQKM